MTPQLTAVAPDLTLYRRYARPLVADSLEAVRLDKHYIRADGDFMTYRGLDGETVEVLDMLGGYGSTFLGHNHPEVVSLAQELLADGVPFHAQASTRVAAGELAFALSERLRRTTGREYVATLANTGAEAIEAALKHAELERYERAAERAERQTRTWAMLVHGARHPLDRLPEHLRAELRRALGDGPVPLTLTEAHERLAAANARVTAEGPLFIAFDRGFHGKTSGALGLTASQDHRAPFSGLLPRTRWLPPGDLAALERAVEAEVTSLSGLAEVGGTLVVREQPWCNVSAIFIEPVQGEGGIRPMEPTFLRGLREIADRWGIPVVVDEIQTGLGRCGAFLASSLLGLRGDYYTFGKSLGGGVAKVAALLVDQARYCEPFGILHTSTFAEDEFGCRLAIRALEISDRDDLADRAARQGRLLKARLDELRLLYPDVIADVRGMGLMIGVEFADQQHSLSNVFRITSGQHLLAYLVAGYLLNEERIRVAPALAGHQTIRLEPSAYVSDAAIERTVVALRRVCEIIQKANAGRLTRSLAGCAVADDVSPVNDYRRPEAPYRDEDPTTSRRVAFIGHLIDGVHLPLSDPSLADIPRERLRHYARTSHRVLGPWVLDRVNITSATGDQVHLSFIGLTVPSTLIAEAMRKRDLAWIQHRVAEGVEMARAQGCSVVGLGGYTSIVTNNCKRLARTDIALTSGNALTVGMGVEAIEHAARQRGIDLRQSRVAAIGAAGNICSVYALMMAEHTDRILLIGRPGSSDRLRTTAVQLYEDAWRRIGHEDPPSLTGLAGAIYPTAAVQRLLAGSETPDDPGRHLYEHLDGEAAGATGKGHVEICEDMGRLSSCDVVISASSSSTPIIHADDLGSGPVVICDLSVPSSVEPSVASLRPDVLVIQGGVVRLPHNDDLVLGGVPLPPGHVFACMAETTLLGLSGHDRHYSFGSIAKPQVHAILALARAHGYRLGHLKQDPSY